MRRSRLNCLAAPLPDLESLRCFSQAARQLSFRRAAKACALSPAAFGERMLGPREDIRGDGRKTRDSVSQK